MLLSFINKLAVQYDNTIDIKIIRKLASVALGLLITIPYTIYNLNKRKKNHT